jgi:hypothetical protein
VGIDPIDRRPSSGGHPGWAIPHGTAQLYTDALIQGWAKRSVPTTCLNHAEIVGTALRAFAHPTGLSVHPF